MHIDETKVFLFVFDTGSMGDIQIPVRAQTREEAADVLQKMFGKMQTEISMEFPRVQVAPRASAPSTPITPAAQSIDSGFGALPPMTAIPSEVLEMRIDTLLGDLGFKGIAGEQRIEAIRNWLDMDFTPENYPQIVNGLEEIASGKREVKPKGKKKQHD